jgi:cytochrome c peroxidase
MPHVASPLAALRRSRTLGLSPPRSGGAWLGILLSAVGVILLGLASAPMLAGAATPPTCKADGTDTVTCFFEPEAEEGVPFNSLKTVTLPTDAQLAPGGRFVRNQTALEQLGKALFWDQQVGSDGQACGTCHFSAGADVRTRNQASPGMNATPVDTTFQNGLGPNHTISASDFPFHKLADPNNRLSTVQRDSNDVWSSSGVFNRTFTSIQANSGGLRNPDIFDFRAFDNCQSVRDPSGFSVNGINTRRAEPRNTPTMINAMFTNRNFWDSRAQNRFNGVDPFGDRDTAARVFENQGSSFSPNVQAVRISIDFASLESQSVGPPLSNNEMSCGNRTFPDVGHKMLTSTNQPLAEQDVDASDSLLGGLSNSRVAGRTTEGLNTTYRDMIQNAFQSRWWNANRTVTVPGVPGARPQIEANFSLFWGLSVGAYMKTLRADNSEMDRFFDPNSNEQLSDSEFRGLVLFSSAGGTRPFPIRNPTQRVAAFLFDGRTPADLRCTACHGGPETTAASIDAVTEDARLERMAQLPVNGVARCAIYDAGHFNTGVRPVNNDAGLGGRDGTAGAFPLGETQAAIDGTLNRINPSATAPFGLTPALNRTTNCDEANVNGTFKAPQLRNVELTGPYFHNGGQLTLRQVVDFYNRGGDFQDQREFDPNVHRLNLGTQDKTDLVNFLLALTDPRVATESAPFDHPQICVSNGHPDSQTSVRAGPNLPGFQQGGAPRALFNVECHAATGRDGGARLQPFLGANQQSP